MRISSASIRSGDGEGDLGSVIGLLGLGLLAHVDLGRIGVILAVAGLGALGQSVAERNALVEHETFAAPKALRLGNLFQIFQDAALEVIDLLEALRQQVGTGLFAADAA